MVILSSPIQHVQVEFRPYVDWRLRLERRLDRDFLQQADDDRSDLIWRIRPGVEWSKGKKWSGEVQYQLAADSIRTRSLSISDDFSDVNLAFVKYRDGQLEVTAGRQKINIGSERLIGSMEWTAAGRAFDGVRVKSGKWDAFAAKVGVGFPKPGRARYAGATYRSQFGLTQLFFKHDSGTPDTDHWTLAHAFERKTGRWQFEAEGAVQFGHAGGKDLRAWAVHGSLNYQVDPKTKLSFEANAASGGSNANTTYTFDNLSPSNHKFYGSMDMLSWRNMEELAVAVDHKFNPKWSGKLSWRTFALRDSSDAWYGAGGGVNRGGFGPFVDPTGASGKDLGREIDLELMYKHSATITASAGVGLFVPGGFVRARNGGQTDHQTWGYLMLQMRF